MADPTAQPEAPYEAMTETELLARFTKWNTACDSHWSDWRKEARDHYDMYANRHWDKDEREALKDAGRQVVTINRTTTIIDAVSGAEIMGRQEAAYYPREVGDSAVNEILTKGAEWVRDQTDADFEESEATRDAFICGMGWTETRMDYEEEIGGKIIIERVDPLQMSADPGHTKPGCSDSRYLRRKKPVARDDFERLFPGHTGGKTDNERAQTHVTNHGQDAYDHADASEALGQDDVYVCEWQWYDVEPAYLTADPEAEDGVRFVDDAEAQALQATGARVVSTKRRRYYRAFTSGDVLLKPVEELPDGEFTYKAITGKRDRNKRTWFGLMRLMRDPQKWANAFFVQILHIIQSTSKGGVYAEEGAIDDIEEFEATLAKSDRVTLLPEGSLSMNKIQPKPMTPYPQGLDRLMEIAVNAIRDATGVNQELLGLVEREQAGVLEDQRKQAAYGILASFFDSLKRYRRGQGKLMLKLMRYLPNDTLFRIVGDDGLAQYVPKAQMPNTAKFDVIVDEAPTSPDQKRKVWATAMQLQPVLKQAGPEVWSVLVEYAPLPATIVAKLKQVIQKQITDAAQPPAPDPLAERGKAASISKLEGEAREAGADASLKEAQAGAWSAGAQFTFPPPPQAPQPPA